MRSLAEVINEMHPASGALGPGGNGQIGGGSHWPNGGHSAPQRRGRQSRGNPAGGRGQGGNAQEHNERGIGNPEGQGQRIHTHVYIHTYIHAYIHALWGRSIRLSGSRNHSGGEVAMLGHAWSL